MMKNISSSAADLSTNSSALKLQIYEAALVSFNLTLDIHEATQLPSDLS